ncbi:MAG: PQQ-binding-like beta-propeller repeat protein [Phycisphaerae bacterium]
MQSAYAPTHRARPVRLAVLGLLVCLTPSAPAGGASADEILECVGAPRGIVAVLGDEGGRTAVGLARADEGVTVFVQVAGADAAGAARRAAHEAGLLGARVFVSEGPLGRIHLADNVADVLVAARAGAAPREEVLRVLRPEGTAILGSTRLTKPSPDGADDWTHVYHGPDNNPQTEDRLARAPYLTQYVASPRYAPAPQAAVAAGGRLFMAFGHVAWHRREEPWMNTLLAVNAFNGTHLWRRPLEPGIMVDRCTMVATPDRLYLGTSEACLVLDAATGEVRDRLVAPAEVADGPFWKWMALSGGRLFALLGPKEESDPNAKWRRGQHGWPWNGISKGYNAAEYQWGFGRTLLAIDPETKKVLWHHREDRPVDGRAVCMKNGRIYVCRFGEYLACLNASSGKEVWRRTKADDGDLFEKIGPYRPGHGYVGGWKSTVYLRCTDRAVYFLGPQVNHLTAVSAEDGRFLWRYPAKDLHIVVRDDGLYTIGPQKSTGLTHRLDPVTGKVLADFDLCRRACTRSVGTPDGIIFRTQGGSQRLDLATGRVQYISTMRPSCHVGVVVAGGHLHWVPWVCDCNLQMFGVIGCGPAGDFDFAPKATETARLETAAGGGKVKPLDVRTGDWPVYRRDAARSAATEVAVAKDPKRRWTFAPAHPCRPTAPVAAGGMVFVAGEDGGVRALDAGTGKVRWTAWTGGPVRYPPSVSDGRALVGSADGWAYCYEAATGRRLWRFRAAPRERRIRLYGALASTWPVSSGVLTADGAAYLAAGINNFDGTHVYALDAATGTVRWQNSRSGHLDAFSNRGVAAQGDLLLHDGRLYLAGGNAVSPGVYRADDGTCLSAPPKGWASPAPRGRELVLDGGRVRVTGQPLYATAEARVFDRSVAWTEPVVRTAEADLVAEERSGAWVLAARATGGKAERWHRPLPAAPVRWGVAVDRDGRIVVSLEDGRVVCFGKGT